MKKDETRKTSKTDAPQSISQDNGVGHGEPEIKPQKRNTLRASVFEKGWSEGEVKWSRSADFDATFFVKGVTEVDFTEFVFTNAHANAIMSAPKDFRKSLDMLNAGWMDEKGMTDDAKMRDPDEVTNETLVSLAKSCPNLQSVYLHGRLLSDLALEAFVQHCPKLESFTIGSNGIATNGTIRGSALKALRKNPDWAPELWKLCIHGYDGTSRKLKRAITKLTAARPELFISIEDNVTRLSIKIMGGQEDVFTLTSDTSSGDSDVDDEQGMLDSKADADDDNWEDCDNEEVDGYEPGLEMAMMDEIFGDSALGDFMFNQYANGNDMHGFLF